MDLVIVRPYRRALACTTGPHSAYIYTTVSATGASNAENQDISCALQHMLFLGISGTHRAEFEHKFAIAPEDAIVSFDVSIEKSKQASCD